MRKLTWKKLRKMTGKNTPRQARRRRPRRALTHRERRREKWLTEELDTEAWPRHRRSTYFLSRKIINDEWRLSPYSDEIEKLLIYALGAFAIFYRIRLHAVVLMANHIHIVFTDLDGRHSDFQERFFSYTSRFLNLLLYGRRNGPFWAPKSERDTLPILTPHALLNRIAYTISNPVHHGVVREHERYVGFATTVESFQKPLYPRRPSTLPTATEMPGRTTLRMWVPECFEAYCPTTDDFVALLKRRVRAYERMWAEQMESDNRIFDEEQPCKMYDVYRRRKAAAAMKLDLRPHTRTRSAPRFVADDRRVAAEYFDYLATWRAKYILARKAKLEGQYDVEFPPGTYQRRVHGGDRAQPLPIFIMPDYCPDREREARESGRGLPLVYDEPDSLA